MLYICWLFSSIESVYLFDVYLFVARTGGSGKAMKLGSKAKDVDSFVDKLRSEGAGEEIMLCTIKTLRREVTLQYGDFCGVKTLSTHRVFSRFVSTLCTVYIGY